jgi:hypothetical protein
MIESDQPIEWVKTADSAPVTIDIAYPVGIAVGDTLRVIGVESRVGDDGEPEVNFTVERLGAEAGPAPAPTRLLVNFVSATAAEVRVLRVGETMPIPPGAASMRVDL